MDPLMHPGMSFSPLAAAFTNWTHPPNLRLAGGLSHATELSAKHSLNF